MIVFRDVAPKLSPAPFWFSGLALLVAMDPFCIKATSQWTDNGKNQQATCFCSQVLHFFRLLLQWLGMKKKLSESIVESHLSIAAIATARPVSTSGRSKFTSWEVCCKVKTWCLWSPVNLRPPAQNPTKDLKSVELVAELVVFLGNCFLGITMLFTSPGVSESPTQSHFFRQSWGEPESLSIRTGVATELWVVHET